MTSNHLPGECHIFKTHRGYGHLHMLALIYQTSIETGADSGVQIKFMTFMDVAIASVRMSE